MIILNGKPTAATAKRTVTMRAQLDALPHKKNPTANSFSYLH
jgi:hypothetical protein